MTKMKLASYEIMLLGSRVAASIKEAFPVRVNAYPVPRGGVPAAFAIAAGYGGDMNLVAHPDFADIIVDDIIDSGETRDAFAKSHPGKGFYALIDKPALEADNAMKRSWIVFPWEGDAEASIEPNITRLLQFIGENPSREGLKETPRRVAKAWGQWTSGYDKDAGSLLKVFTDGAEGCDEMVVVKDIPIYSKCEHHLADIFGTVTIAYIPNGKIVGLSKLSRLADMFARRLQVQERLTNQIADALVEHLNPKGVGVIIRARHMCMESRGICQQGHHTITSALRGVLKDIPAARAEFISLS